jgi:hypothetical protein
MKKENDAWKKKNKLLTLLPTKYFDALKMKPTHRSN